MYSISDLPPRGVTFFAFNWAVILLTFPLVFLRLFARANIANTFGVDDLLLGLSLASFIATGVLGIFLSLQGYGAPMHDLSNADIEDIFKMLYAHFITLYVAIILLRLSVCVFYLRITAIVWQRRFVYFIATLTTVVQLMVLFVKVFNCWPVHYQWTFTPGWQDYCLDSGVMTGMLYLQYSVSVCADWMLAILPLFFIHRVNMTTNSRTWCAILSVIGLVPCISAMICLAQIPDLVFTTQDFTYDSVNPIIWATCEPFAALVLISIAGYRPFFKSMKPQPAAHFVVISGEDDFPPPANPSWHAHFHKRHTPEMAHSRRGLDLRGLHEPPPKHAGSDVGKSYAEAVKENEPINEKSTAT